MPSVPCAALQAYANLVPGPGDVDFSCEGDDSGHGPPLGCNVDQGLLSASVEINTGDKYVRTGTVLTFAAG